MENKTSLKAFLVIAVVVIAALGIFFLSSREMKDPSQGPIPHKGEGEMNGDTANESQQKESETLGVEIQKETKINSRPREAGFTSTNSQKTTDVLLPVDHATVFYTEKGFHPNIVLINEGGSVTFVNESSAAMRIQSLPEDAYPSFSQSYSVGREGEFTFVFLRSGQWRYHNTNKKSDEGVVLVVPQ